MRLRTHAALIIAALFAPIAASAPVDIGAIAYFAQSQDGARVNLHEGKGPCEGEARYAQHIAPDGAKTGGCWVFTDGVVLVSFLDGDRGNIPAAHLRKAEKL